MRSNPLRRATRPVVMAAAGLLMATSLAACASDAEVAEDPAAALSEAVSALGDYDGVELTLRLEADRDALAAEVGDGDIADLILQSSLTFRGSGETADDSQAEMLVTIGGDDVVELRIIGDSQFYVRVDLDVIADLVDDPEFSAGINQMVGMAAMFGLSDVAQALADGRWIQLIGLEEFADMFGDMDEPSEEDLEAVRDRLTAALERFVDDDVAVEHVDSDATGERLRLTTDGAALQRLLEEITAIVSVIGGVDQSQFDQFDGDEIPADLTISLDAWISGGRLVQVGFDLSELEDSDAPAGTMLLIEIAEFTGSVAPPDDAETFDLFAVLGDVMGGFGDLGDLDGTDDDFGAPGADCLTQDDIETIIEFGGEEAEEEIQAAIDAGLIEVC